MAAENIYFNLLAHLRTIHRGSTCDEFLHRLYRRLQKGNTRAGSQVITRGTRRVAKTPVFLGIDHSMYKKTGKQDEPDGVVKNLMICYSHSEES
jgi:hypothetical protein